MKNNYWNVVLANFQDFESTARCQKVENYRKVATLL
tara:strand:- start:413 stop:520 length:108 start_codon:yes stop_codon:yes gene_type:complete